MTKSIYSIHNLQQYAEKHWEFTPSKKLFYKKYSHNITLRNESLWFGYYRDIFYSQRSSSFDSDEAKREREERKRIVNQMRAKQKCITDFLDTHGADYRTRREKRFNIYINDNDMIMRVMRKWPDMMVCLEGPSSDVHLEKMEHNVKIVVKKQLYYKKYRYKVAYKTTRDFIVNVVPTIINFRETTMENREHMKLSNNFYRLTDSLSPSSIRRNTIYPWNSASVYLKDENDYVMYKLFVGGDPFEEHEVVTIDELENDK